MPVERRPLFRPDVVAPRAQATACDLAAAARERLARWARLLDAPGSDRHRESQLLPDFLSDVFYRVLGYAGPAAPGERYSLDREWPVEVDGERADAVLGDFSAGNGRVVAVVEGKGPRDPLDRPFGGRRLSAVEQAYRYAINVPCDWIVVTNLRELRLYHKGHDLRTFERFEVVALAADDAALGRFVYLLGAERVVPPSRPGHLDELLSRSERAGIEVTAGFYDEYATMRRELLARLREANPALTPELALSYAQKLLDRVLFIAFAEDRCLLPVDTLARAIDHQDLYHPHSRWEMLRVLFDAIDRGRPALDIPRYNGGLFAADPDLDGLAVPDEPLVRLRRLGEYDYRPAAEAGDAASGAGLVDVELLGHVFERSITDLEAIERELSAGAYEIRRVSRRKREGAFYTPRAITRFIVGRALQPVLAARFEALRRRRRADDRGTALRALDDPRVYDLDRLNRPQKDALAFFWKSWVDELQTVRVLDPAVGSGAFLIEAFDQLHAAYQDASARLTELFAEGAAATIFETDRTILGKNLYGVDLNAQAIEICRLSIWIKTAKRGQPLASLDHNLRVGNSLVDDPTLHGDALDWRAAFPEVFADGGFDVVLGNPPYVRQELLGPLKPYLESRYTAYHGMADLYVYFFERGLELLRPGGRLSFVVTNKWLKAGYAEPLRRHLAAAARVEALVDLGHAKAVFPEADVFPSIVVLARPGGEPAAAPPPPRVAVISRDEVRLDDLGRQVDEEGFELDPSRLGAAPWTLEPPAVERLMEKARRAGVPLAEYAGVKPYYGIKTGLNEAFLIDTATRERLIAEDGRSEEVLRPCLRGQDVERWRPEWKGLWMILLKSSDDREWPWSGLDPGAAEDRFAHELPAIHRHLAPLRERLIRRQDQGRFWWELRRCAYYEAFEREKILWQEISWGAEFALDDRRLVTNNTAYVLAPSDLWLLAVLNSPLFWWTSWRRAVHGKDEALRLVASFIETFPVAPAGDRREAAEKRVSEIVDLVREEQEARRIVLDWLAVEHDLADPGRRLADPLVLSSEQLVAEVHRARGKKRPLTAGALRGLRGEHERTIAPAAAKRRRMAALERELSALVEAAYALTPEESDLLWRTAPPRMPIPRP